MTSILPLAVTMGDAAGIGPEIIARHFAAEKPRDLVVVGDLAQMERAIRMIGAEIPVERVEGPIPAPAGCMAVLPVGSLPADLPYGEVDARAGKLAYAAILAAIRLAKSEQVSGIVTAPVHKEALHAAGVPFPGHTEILAHETGTRDFAMMLADEKLRVILVSIHVSLAEALRRVTQEAELRTIRLADQACRALGIAKPRIAVAGLNPHAGEGGLFGREEIEIIAPAIAEARSAGLDVHGPFPPDTIFMQARRGAYDIVVSQYHDQGLIAVKLNGIEKGVNVTIGLPIIRTSVDHGTAFDIAGKGIADPSSLSEAIRVARQMVAARGG
ncbi:MAG: 4-hydroxythreonine-4-phosphate dehydrogenase PdxA [Methylobacterium sp.]|nr:4-hydroxythreonine-4-phosphate dehydrogenase PdxA [Methylobacterium sp.]MCA3599479.1 4-hydroxythreonine-4-phosphate dehydrogenase PdxA [Methylobacterium sp.]MCA3602975.1 4-hydroxythreonine-4-phosphate dehydrogenase PdxA [Methylobacterium sp.]MCA3607864.1 4-hydroxythreonine-4-phosphate dehydrogenase PdxA [Methylobacterium sp.]MCA3609998.1 4-hydroxythreonine-4-phosphate dehydrogenase PdxA [Methylobacterium sp.]